MHFFVQKSLLTKNYFLTAEINLNTRGPLYTCLVLCTCCILVLFCLTLFSNLKFVFYFFFYPNISFDQKLSYPNIFSESIAGIDLTAHGPLYTCFVLSVFCYPMQKIISDKKMCSIFARC